MKKLVKTATLISSLLFAVFYFGTTTAEINPFEVTESASQVELAGDKKCGEGKCEGKKCGEGKCEGKKCGEGKCEGKKCGDKKEGKCEGKKCGDKNDGKCGDK
jgi:uncharacterized low-complexity protein